MAGLGIVYPIDAQKSSVSWTILLAGWPIFIQFGEVGEGEFDVKFVLGIWEFEANRRV